MPTFAVKKLDEFECNLNIFALVRDGICFYDDAVNELMKDGNLRKELKRVYALIQFVGNHGTRHKNIHQLKDIPNFTTWELKTNHLRFYFLYGQGMMIISGGKKLTKRLISHNLNLFSNNYQIISTMFTKEELLEDPEYLLARYQNEIYYQLDTFMSKNNFTQSEIASKLGVSSSYVSQVLNGNFNFTLKS